MNALTGWLPLSIPASHPCSTADFSPGKLCRIFILHRPALCRPISMQGLIELISNQFNGLLRKWLLILCLPNTSPWFSHICAWSRGHRRLTGGTFGDDETVGTDPVVRPLLISGLSGWCFLDLLGPLEQLQPQFILHQGRITDHLKMEGIHTVIEFCSWL